MKTLRSHILIILMAGLCFLAGCGSDSGSSGSQSAQASYSQADLAGTWYLSFLRTMPTSSGTPGFSGWMRGSATIDGSGVVTASSLADNIGPMPPMTITGSAFTIDPVTGTISMTASTSLTVFHGRLASNKQLLVGTTSVYTGPYPPYASQLCIMQKRSPQAVYNAADIMNRNLMISQVESGNNTSDWMFAKGTTDSAATVSVPVFTYPTGTAPGGTLGSLMIDQVSGLVTLSSNSSFQGMMSPDKTYIVATETDVNDSTTHRMTVIQMRNQSQIFSQTDIVGNYDFYILGTHLGWGHGTQVINAAGNMTITSYTSNWQASIGMYSTRLVAADGLVSDQTSTFYYGVLAATKDFIVGVRTYGNGPESTLTISLKR